MPSANELDVDDWIELLALDAALTDLRTGRSYPADARRAIDARRDVYPGVLGDYVVVLDALAGQVDAVEAAIDQQNTTLDRFNTEIAAAGLRFDWDPGRLLTDAERERIDAIGELLHEQEAAALEAAEEAGEGADELEEAIGALETRLGDLDADVVSIEAQIADLEEALAEAEEG